jgi:hypothetical protein
MDHSNSDNAGESCVKDGLCKRCCTQLRYSFFQVPKISHVWHMVGGSYGYGSEPYWWLGHDKIPIQQLEMPLVHTSHVDASRSPHRPSQLQREGQASAFKKTLRTRTIASYGVYKQLGEQDGMARYVNLLTHQNWDFIKFNNIYLLFNVLEPWEIAILCQTD